MNFIRVSQGTTVNIDNITNVYVNDAGNVWCHLVGKDDVIQVQKPYIKNLLAYIDTGLRDHYNEVVERVEKEEAERRMRQYRGY